MKTGISKVAPSILLILYTILLSGFTGCTHEKKEDVEEEIDLTVELVPSGEQVISGNQEMLVLYDMRRTIEVKNIMYDTGDGFKPIDTSGSPPVINPGEYKFIFCAECLDAPKVKLKVEFTEESETAPLETEYTIDRLPVINLIAEETEPGIVILNAGESIDPEGKELKFTWLSDTMSVEGPLFGGNIDSINSGITILSVTDGVAVINKLIKINRTPDDGTVVPVAGILKAKCDSLLILFGGKSFLNPTLRLGPVPAIGDTIPIDTATKKLKQKYFAGYKFEVGGFVKSSPNLIFVGQDVATSSIQGSDTSVTQGFKRNADGKTFDKKKKIAPLCPIPAPKKFTPAPSLIADDYSLSSFSGVLFQNTATGVREINIIGKRERQFGKAVIIAWFDAPGSVFPKDFDFSKGYKRNSLFRAFMKEDITKCEKYFYYELEIDSNGVVRKNTITRLN